MLHSIKNKCLLFSFMALSFFSQCLPMEKQSVIQEIIHQVIPAAKIATYVGANIILGAFSFEQGASWLNPHQVHLHSYKMKNYIMQKPWKHALFAGIGIAACTRLGTWPKLELSDVYKPVTISAAGILLTSLFSGILKYKLGSHDSSNPHKSSGKPGLRRTQEVGKAPDNHLKATATNFAHKAAINSAYIASILVPVYLLYKRYQLSIQ